MRFYVIQIRLVDYQGQINQMSALSNELNECGFHDVITCGDCYTWCNNSKGDNTMLAKLDRSVCNY